MFEYICIHVFIKFLFIEFKMILAKRFLHFIF
jgi:hypothetical protein